MEMLPYIERILDAAHGAPSRDNLQPWRFVVEGNIISFFVDSDRDKSPMNAGERMARIALGAALECAILRAGRMGSIVRSVKPHPHALISISISPPKRVPEPDKALLRRATNRRQYDARPVDDETFGWLRETSPPIDTVRTHWFGRERVRIIAPIIEEAETLFYGHTRIRDAEIAALRFDLRDRDEPTFGLSLASLELSAPDRVTFDALRRRTPQDRLEVMGAFKKIGARARKLVESSSGVCILEARGSDPLVEVNVGRSMQRAWLALTRRGMVAHPMSSIPAMEAMLEYDEKTKLHADAERLASVVAAFRAAFPSVDRTSRIALAMRFGWAAVPTARVGRMPLRESTLVRMTPLDQAEPR